jgi:hypothetical protein
MTVLTEGRYPGEAIMTEGADQYSRDNLKVAASQTIVANSLLARKAVASGVTVTVSDPAAGRGALTMADPAVSSKVKDGVYKAVCTGVASNSGTFRVEDPNGVHIGNATVGTPFNKEIKFTIADGGTDFALGDEFLITVAADDADFEYVAYDPTATDGAETPVAYSIYPVTTGVGVTKKTAGITRHAQLNGNCIAWPAGITSAQKVDAVQALAAVGIIVR